MKANKYDITEEVEDVEANEETKNDYLLASHNMRMKDRKEWLKMMDDEIKSLHDKNTWNLIKKPGKAILVSCKSIFKVKEVIKGFMPMRFTKRMVARVFTQKE